MPNKFFDDFVQMACDEAKVGRPRSSWRTKRVPSSSATILLIFSS
jgi:hypothetical protein